MRLDFACPACRRTTRTTSLPPQTPLRCSHCGWERGLSEEALQAGTVRRCLVCGCEDLWRQKDFPQRWGLALVVAGIVLSTIAWANWRPLWAIGILMAFALADMLLYTFMPDVLVCYRCRARHRDAAEMEKHAGFDLETAERYRQEARRVGQSMTP